MLRRGVCATILWLPGLFAGCAASAHPGMDSAQQRWEETARRCRGELLLVRNDGSLLPAPALPSADDDGPDDAAHLRLRAAADAAQAAAELAQFEYQAGLRDFSDVLDAERSLLSFQDQLRQSEGVVVANVIRLYKALGGGWTSMAEAATTGEVARQF